MIEGRQKPKVLRKFVSDEQCSSMLGSFNQHFKRKPDPENPAYEIYDFHFDPIEIYKGNELLKQCQKVIDAEAAFPEDIKGTVTILEEDGSEKRVKIAGMNMADYITKTWEYRLGYIREDRETYNKTRREIELLKKDEEIARLKEELEATKAKKGDK